MKRFLIYLLSGLLCQVSFCNGQQHLFRLLNTQNGLYNNQVRFIQQLTDGRILSYTEGMFTIVEIGPGKVLTGFVRKTTPEMNTYAVETVADIQALIQALKEEN